MKETGRFFIQSWMRFLAVVLLCGMLFSTASPRSARAICSPDGICAAIGTVTGSMSAIWSGVISPALTAAETTIITTWDTLLLTFEITVYDQIETFEDEFTAWWDLFWWYDLRPTLQNMTGQFVSSDVAATRDLGSFFDAAQQNKTHLAFQKAEIDAHRASRPSDQVCVVATAAGGMTRANTVRKAMNRAWTADRLAIGTNRTHKIGGPPTPKLPTSVGQDTAERWDNYLSRYCHDQDNDGSSGCVVSGFIPGADVNVIDTLFQKDTLDLFLPDVRLALEDLNRNTIEPYVMAPLPRSTLDGTTGQENMLRRRSVQAQRLLAHEAFAHIVARRAPGARQAAFVENIRFMAGIDWGLIAGNQSYEEVMSALISDRFHSGVYHNNLIDAPEGLDKELVTLQAWQVIQQQDHLDLMDRFAMMLAAQTANEINARGMADATSAQPNQ